MLTVEIVDRVLQLATHKHAPPVLDLFEAVRNTDADPAVYLDIVEMQLDLLQAASAFLDKRGHVGWLRSMATIAQTLGCVTAICSDRYAGPTPGHTLVHCAEHYVSGLQRALKHTDADATSTPTSTTLN